MRAFKRYMFINSYISMLLLWDFNVTQWLLHNRLLTSFKVYRMLKTQWNSYKINSANKWINIETRNRHCLCVLFTFHVIFSMPGKMNVYFCPILNWTDEIKNFYLIINLYELIFEKNSEWFTYKCDFLNDA